MGLPTTPQDAAPAYDQVYNDHHYEWRGPSGSGAATNGTYASVPQDDVELHAHDHNTPPTTTPGSQPESLAQTIAGVFRPKPHVHCEQCDAITTAREQRESEKHCCSMVAATFMVGFVCFMILGIIVSSAMFKAKRHGHD